MSGENWALETWCSTPEIFRSETVNNTDSENKSIFYHSLESVQIKSFGIWRKCVKPPKKVNNDGHKLLLKIIQLFCSHGADIHKTKCEGFIVLWLLL